MSRPMWISNYKKVCRQKLVNIDKPTILLSSLLKYDPLGNVVSISFSSRIEINTTKIVNSKSLKKICRQLLSTINVLKCFGPLGITVKSSQNMVRPLLAVSSISEQIYGLILKSRTANCYPVRDVQHNSSSPYVIVYISQDLFQVLLVAEIVKINTVETVPWI